MKETFEAVYENGLLRPLRRLDAREGQRVLVSIESEPSDNDVTRSAYDFSDLIGRLTWRGDALAEQKRMRDEWS